VSYAAGGKLLRYAPFCRSLLLLHRFFFRSVLTLNRKKTHSRFSKRTHSRSVLTLRRTQGKPMSVVLFCLTSLFLGLF